MSASPPILKVCPACGATVVPDALLGHCPKCLAKLGLMEEAGVNSDPPPVVPSDSRQFGNYRLLRQIGRGGMGVVYEAHHLQLRRSVALKVILAADAASPVVWRRFHIEAEAAAKLDHPHIVPIYEVGEHDGQPFISMKLVQGQSLAAHIKQGDFCGANGLNRDLTIGWGECQTRIVQLVAKVARAVQHAHENGVLHRDLKPGNILLDEQAHPFLTDFGLAKMEEHTRDGTTPSPTVSGTILGTPSYMSPEQAAGSKVSPASDIYSIGAILYELLTRRPPFHANTPLETMRLVMEQQPRRPRSNSPQIHTDLETICLKCLEKSPAARYATAKALAEDLERWLRHEPITARPTGPALRAQRWIRRNPVGSALILSLGLGLGVALFLLNIAEGNKRKAEKKEQEANRAVMVMRENERLRIINEWGDTNKQMVKISSELLSVLGYYNEPEEQFGVKQRITFAVNFTEHPVLLAEGYVPFLKRIERELSKRLNRSILIDLVLCREWQPQYKFVANGQTDLQRMGPLPYVLAHDLNPNIQPVVCEDLGKAVVIYVRRDVYEQGVTNLSKLVNHSFAFGDVDSTVSFMAKVRLARAGISGTNLSNFKLFQQFEPESLERFSAIQASTLTEESTEFPVFRSTREALIAVLDGKFDAGAARLSYFEKYQDQLVALDSFETPADVYVARAGLDPNLMRAFRECLLNLDDPDLLSNLPLKPLQQFLSTSDADYEELRQWFSNEVLKFDPSYPDPTF